MRTRIALAAGAALLLVAAAPVAAVARRTATPDTQLLATYEPVMQFDPLERFEPTKVESFLTDAGLEQSTAPATWSVVAQNAAPGDLPGPGSGTWRLDQNGCTPASTLGGLDCYAAASDQGGGGPTAYSRVTREDGDIILQYWFFYYDDLYSYAYPPSDLLWQAHEGDWENVNVVLGDDEQPLYVGYSQHCLGERRAWSDTDRVEGTHPVVHVALGSHANYFTDGTHPINVDCIPKQAVAVLQAMHLPLPVDYAFAGPTAGPPGTSDQRMPIEDIGDGAPSWLQFPGTWGELQYFHAPAPIGTVASGASPVGPAFHPEWTDPLGTLASWPES
jgi:hypothetical protein